MEVNASMPGQVPLGNEAVKLDQKFCMDCGKVIHRRAEICPGCGCRQAPVVRAESAFNFGISSTPELQQKFVTQMAMLLLLNFFWSGLGNLSIGDKRGWSYGFVNWIVFIIGCFTLWLPCLAYFAYTGYEGHKFLVAKHAQIISEA